jgi:hypothetical protein
MRALRATGADLRHLMHSDWALDSAPNLGVPLNNTRRALIGTSSANVTVEYDERNTDAAKMMIFPEPMIASGRQRSG